MSTGMDKWSSGWTSRPMVLRAGLFLLLAVILVFRLRAGTAEDLWNSRWQVMFPWRLITLGPRGLRSRRNLLVCW